MLANLFESISEFLAGSVAMSLYWGLAIGGSVILLAVLAMSGFELGGVDTPGDVASDGTFDVSGHVDTGYADFQFISLRTILAFITVFGWAGVIWGPYGIWGFLAALGCGIIAMSLTALAVWILVKLQHSGNIRNTDLVGKTGTVYLNIPAGRAPGGRVTVALESSTREVPAVADDALATGTPVRILSCVNETVYLVSKV